MAATALIAAPLFLLASACDETNHGKPAPTGSASAAAEAPPAPSALTPALRLARAERAEKLFRAECSGCHGEHGRGDGPAAAVLDVKPRNFVREKFKVRTTDGPPTRQDIFATITRGMPGSAMPPFAFLTEEERWLLVDHVWTLAGLDAKKPGKAVPMTPEGPNDAASIARGKAIYERLECGKCHGAEGKGDGQSAKTLKDDQDRPILPRDLTREHFRGGDGADAVTVRFRTGMDGTPMPSYSASIKPDETWDLAHFIVSLRAPKPAPPTDPVEYGRAVVQEKQCNACHVIEGKGGRVGPNLDTSAQKLQYGWAKGFLKDPRSYGKIYPYIAYRMPNLGLTDPEIDAVLSLFAKTANRTYPDTPEKPVALDDAKVKDGQLLYFVKCTECHNMGTVIPTPEAKRQGPDLINVTKRMRFEFMPQWVRAPQLVNPDAHMVDTNLNDEEIAQVTQFVWKTSLDAANKK